MNPITTREPINCLTCGKELLGAWFSRSDMSFCSIECDEKFEASRLPQPPAPEPNRTCPLCKIHSIQVHGDREICAASWCNYFKMIDPNPPEQSIPDALISHVQACNNYSLDDQIVRRIVGPVLEWMGRKVEREWTQEERDDSCAELSKRFRIGNCDAYTDAAVAAMIDLQCELTELKNRGM